MSVPLGFYHGLIRGIVYGIRLSRYDLCVFQHSPSYFFLMFGFYRLNELSYSYFLLLGKWGRGRGWGGAGEGRGWGVEGGGGGLPSLNHKRRGFDCLKFQRLLSLGPKHSKILTRFIIFLLLSYSYNLRGGL